MEAHDPTDPHPVDFRTPSGRAVTLVEGLGDAAGVRALSLVWEAPQRIVIDKKWWNGASPIRREFLLWHEEKHGDFVRRYGMTIRAGWRNVMLDFSYRIIPYADEAVWRLLRWMRDR